MRLLLMHNPTAGHGAHERRSLTRALEREGHDVRYCSTKEEGWRDAFDREADVVVVAGGDGTVRKAAIELTRRRLAGRLPIAILAVGTGNNVARALGSDADPASLGETLRAPVRKRLAVGAARAPWGTQFFVEAAGIGAFAEMLRTSAEHEREAGKEAYRGSDAVAGAAHLADVLATLEPRQLRVRADDADLSGAYLLVEAMNVPVTGPRLELASTADPGDAWLDLVAVAVEDRERMIEYLERQVRGTPATSPIVPRRVRRVRLQWSTPDGHVDDALWPEDGKARAGDVELSIEDAITVLAPASAIRERPRSPLTPPPHS